MESKVSFSYLFGCIIKIMILFLLAELFFQTIIPACSSPYTTFDNKEKILKFDNSKLQDGIYTYGNLAEIQARWHVNNMGWLSDQDYKINNDKPVIAVIGDSYIEAFQVDPEKSMTNNLQKRLVNSYDVYSFGMSGAPLSGYLQISRYVRNNFHPDVLILFVNYNDIQESLLGSKNKPGMIYFSSSNIGVAETLIPYVKSNNGNFRKSALLRYIILNNGMFNGMLRGSSTPKLSSVSSDKNNYKIISDITSYAFTKIRQENNDSAVIIVSDTLRDNIYSNRILDINLYNKYTKIKKIIHEKSYENGFHFIDLTTPMTMLYTKNNLNFEFKNNSHWNEYGNKVVADQVYNFMIDSRIISAEKYIE